MKTQSAGQDLFSSPETAEALQHHLLGEREEAEKAFVKLLAKDPSNHFFRYLLGETKYALGHLEDAVLEYQKAIDLKPDFGVAFYKMGVCLHRMGQLDKSLEAFMKILSMKGQGHAMASYFVGLINQFLGNDKEAEDGFRVLRGSSKESLIANYYLAQLKIKHHKYDEALELLEELLQATPGLAEVHYQKGVVFMGMHRNMDAISCFRKTLELNPGDGRARSNLELLTEVPEP
ncbi:MAG TPA: tetratricopeptide repeat protein [Spirochaetia bacterium]|nr:tetratricopeptide repeat protein [Spirochaetia bacterium]